MGCKGDRRESPSLNIYAISPLYPYYLTDSVIREFYRAIALTELENPQKLGGKEKNGKIHPSFVDTDREKASEVDSMISQAQRGEIIRF